ncbi:MAG: acyltransferase [Planctomycetota bacterium]
MKRSEPLDGLRGLAVLLVLLSHASNRGHDVLPGLDARGVGRSGVFLFFVLSSFLLTSQVLGRLDAGSRVGWGRFAARRLLRVMPAYALCLGVYVALGAMDSGVALRHLALVRAEAHFWTIPVEVLFYLSLPLIGLAVTRTSGVLPRVALLAAAAVAVRAAYPPDFPAKAPDFVPNVLPFLPIFLVGSALAVLAPAITRAAASSAGGRALALLGGAAVLALLALTPAVWQGITREPVPHRRFHLWFDAFALLWAVVVAASALPARSPLRDIVSVRPLRALGRISYSAYLLHAICLAWADQWLPGRVPPALVGPTFLALVVAAGTASYVVVERPFLDLLRSRGDAVPVPDTGAG